MRGGASAGGGACTADMGGRSPGAGTRLPLPARRWTETPAVEPFQIPRPVLSFLLLPSPTSGGFRSGEEERRAALGVPRPRLLQEESRLSSTGPCVPSKKSRDRTWGLTAESPWCQERRDRTRCLWSSV
ncbi:uncharacterized protein LOC111560213 isoform X6 [Felis catus]|uniref:uncharacterized protein LOC111560213 isoform X6 n=1 Tax=Felis catus TaxID=9685 RepID=UPI001D19C9F3|nr:uncharacterized protein LOC111560213 isoform X6 [Felis catus]